MRKLFLLLIPLLSLTWEAQAQGRNIKIGYIDMEYILQNVPDYAQAKNELDQKALRWQQEIEAKRGEIDRLKQALNTERVLLTKELIEEREEEIAFQEKELVDYQQKRFGPTGDLMTQKSVLVKPIQDQVFNAAQDIAESRKYDFIFDKSSDMTMLFAAKRFDISDLVIRALTRASRREQMSKKQLKEEMAQEAKEDMIDENPGLAERQRVLEERRKQRETLAAERAQAAADRRKAAEDKRAAARAEREAAKNGTTVAEPEAGSETPAEPDAAKTAAEERRAAAAADRERKLQERQQAAEERRQKALEAREAAIKAREEKRNPTPKDSTQTGTN